jgi:hypothetical protein
VAGLLWVPVLVRLGTGISLEKGHKNVLALKGRSGSRQGGAFLRPRSAHIPLDPKRAITANVKPLRLPRYPKLIVLCVHVPFAPPGAGEEARGTFQPPDRNAFRHVAGLPVLSLTGGCVQ